MLEEERFSLGQRRLLSLLSNLANKTHDQLVLIFANVKEHVGFYVGEYSGRNISRRENSRGELKSSWNRHAKGDYVNW